MPERVVRDIESFWPDVARAFAEILPHGLPLVGLRDTWRAGVRGRRVALLRAPGAPDLEALLEEVALDAVRAEWTPLEDRDPPRRFEVDDVELLVEGARAPLLIGSQDVLHLEFTQPWPQDAGPPVETSELFQNLVRRLLQIGGEPLHLEKHVTLSPVDSSRLDVLREHVALPHGPSLRPRFDALGFAPPTAEGEPWRSTEANGPFELVATVLHVDGLARVALEKRRRPD